MLEARDGKLVFHYDAEEVWIEAWGENGLRGKLFCQQRARG